MRATLFLGIVAALNLLNITTTNGQNCTGGVLTGIPMNAPTGTFQTVVTTISYYKEFTATSGVTYQLSFCSADGGSATFDTILAILDATGNPARGGRNDDFCGTQSNLVWSCTSSGTYRVLLGEYNVGNCDITNTSLSGTMAYRIPTTGSASDPWDGPSNFVSSSVTSTSFSYIIDKPVVEPTGYIHLRKAGSAPTFVPVDGTNYTPGTTVDGGTTLVQYTDEIPSGSSSGLIAGTTYHYKIYSFNGVGSFINYLECCPLTASVTTLGSSALIPTLTTTAASSIAQTTATSGGNITSDGGAAVTARGVVWSTSTSPTIALTTKTSNGTGTGVFTSSITGLTPSTTYFVRAYATNSVGTAYGSQVSFTTSSALASQPTAQPTNFVSSNITMSSFTFGFTAASGSPSGYIGIANNSGTPSFVPVDGTTYSNGQAVGSGGDYVSFSSSSTSYNITSAASSTTFSYKIYSYNGSGSSTNYLTTSPLSGSVTTLSPDSSPPTVTNSTPVTVAKNAGITFTVTATDAGSGVESVYVDYGKVENVVDIYDFNDSNVSFIELTSTAGSTYTGTIPATSVGVMGIVYYVYAYDNSGNEYFDATPKVITVTADGNGLSVPFTNPGSAQSNYKLISVPLVLDKKTVNDVFGDDLGVYGDKSVWRMFRYQSGKNTELTGTTSIDIGKGYWLISSKAATIDTGPGATFNGSFDTPASLSLTTGWNQIGNPYTFNLLWQDVADWNGTPNVSLKTFNGGSFSNSNVLKSGEGAFVFAQAGGTIEFPLLKNPAAGRVGEIKPNLGPIDSDNWEVLFNIKNGELNNGFGGVGMNKDAAMLNDRFDDFTLPRFFDYLELNHHKQFVDIHYSKDVIPLQDNYTWEFDIESNVSDKIVELTWDNSYFGQNEKQLVLWDESRQFSIDMRKTTVYHFDKNISKSFKVYYGSENFINESVSTNGIVFHEVFPNPAKDKVAFAFSLPSERGDRNITFEVYDLMGKKVGAVIEGNYSPGYHEVIWDIQGQVATPNGMYLVKLKEGLVAKTRKLIIKQ